MKEDQLSKDHPAPFPMELAKDHIKYEYSANASKNH